MVVPGQGVQEMRSRAFQQRRVSATRRYGRADLSPLTPMIPDLTVAGNRPGGGLVEGRGSALGSRNTSRAPAGAWDRTRTGMERALQGRGVSPGPATNPRVA